MTGSTLSDPLVMIEGMKNDVATPHRVDAAEQLTLLPRKELPARFRLAEETRRRGLRHVAEIRQMLAEREAAAEKSNVHRLPPRRQQAA